MGGFVLVVGGVEVGESEEREWEWEWEWEGREEQGEDVEWNTNATARASIPANTPAAYVKDDFCRFGLCREA